MNKKEKREAVAFGISLILPFVPFFAILFHMTGLGS